MKLATLALSTLSFVASAVQAQRAAPDGPVRVLVVYYSMSGNTAALAQAVVDGARLVDGVEAVARSVDQVTADEVRAADGLILGSPTYYAGIAAPLKAFIDGWPNHAIYLGDKVGGAFATGGGPTGGKEFVVVSLLLAMMNSGAVVAGPLYQDDGVRFGYPGASATTPTPGEPLTEDEREEGRRLGQRVADVARRLRHGG